MLERPRRRPRPLTTAALATALLATACGVGGDAPMAAGAGGDDLAVVATTSILGDVVGNLVGDDGTVEVIMPPGSDPHGFEVSARDAGLLRDADLVVANGLQLEEALQSALEAAEADGVRVLEVAAQLDPIPFGGGAPHDEGHDGSDGDGARDDGDEHAHEDDGHADGDEPEEDDGHDERDHAHGPADPHVWHDPLRMADGVHLIAAELARRSEGVPDAEWERRADEYAEQLLAVHDEVEGLLAEVPEGRRKLITNHDAFGYLAHRYDLEVVGTVIPGSSADAETNPSAFAELIATLEEARVPAIFSENIETDRLSEQLASEVLDRSDLEVEVIELFSDSLGEPGSGGGTYLEMLRTNARRIADGLA